MSDIQTKNLIYKTSIVTLTAAFVLTFLYVFYQSSVIFLSALIGIGISALITPLINKLEENLNVPRFIGALLLLALATVLFSVVFFFIGSILYEQFDALKENLPSIINQWEERWTSLTKEYPGVSKALQKQSSSSNITSTFFSYIASLVSNFVSAGTGITLASVIAFFTSVNAKKYYNSLIRTIPEKYQSATKDRLELSQKTLELWFGAQLIDMAIVAFTTAFFLWIFGIKYWAVFGVLTGVLVIIPYVGIIIAVALSVCIIMAVQPDKVLSLLLVYGVTQQIEGGLILPLIMKGRVKIPSAPLIFLMALSGIWFGVLGVLVAPPLFAVALAQYRFKKGY